MYLNIHQFVQLIKDPRVVNYCYSKNGSQWDLYLMGQGAEQEIAHTTVHSREQVDQVYLENGVNRYFEI